MKLSSAAVKLADDHDVSDWEAANQIVRTALDTFGWIDVLINNAGILRDVIFHKMTEADFDAVIRVNLYGTFNLTRAVGVHFRNQGGGAYVHMTSTSGLIGNFGQANYAAAKLGIVALSKAIALESVLQRVLPAFESSMPALERTEDVFTWEPV